jgi:hypothetical protein
VDHRSRRGVNDAIIAPVSALIIPPPLVVEGIDSPVEGIDSPGLAGTFACDEVLLLDPHAATASATEATPRPAAIRFRTINNLLSKSKSW